MDVRVLAADLPIRLMEIEAATRYLANEPPVIFGERCLNFFCAKLSFALSLGDQREPLPCFTFMGGVLNFLIAFVFLGLGPALQSVCAGVKVVGRNCPHGVVQNAAFCAAIAAIDDNDPDRKTMYIRFGYVLICFFSAPNSDWVRVL
jgi:hypothetical protein